MQKMPDPIARRVYVGVQTYTDPDGNTRIESIKWEDGSVWHVDRNIDIRPAIARKAGGVGMRYLVSIYGRRREIYFVDGRWFVEVAEPPVA